MVSLSKGEKVSLSKGGGLTTVAMGLGWDAAKKGGGLLGGLFGGGSSDGDIDLDASVGLFDAGGRLVDVVYFGNLRSRDGAVAHGGDNLTGEGEGDDEVIAVDLTRLPAEVATLVFTVSSYRGQRFTEVANAFCRLVDTGGVQGPPKAAAARGRELARYNLTGGQNVTGMVMAKVARDGSGWSMTAIGEPGDGRTVQDLMPVISRHV